MKNYNSYKYFVLRNVRTGKVVVGNHQGLIAEKINVTRGNLSRVIKGKLNDTKGWVFVEVRNYGAIFVNNITGDRAYCNDRHEALEKLGVTSQQWYRLMAGKLLGAYTCESAPGFQLGQPTFFTL